MRTSLAIACALLFSAQASADSVMRIRADYATGEPSGRGLIKSHRPCEKKLASEVLDELTGILSRRPYIEVSGEDQIWAAISGHDKHAAHRVEPGSTITGYWNRSTGIDGVKKHAVIIRVHPKPPGKRQIRVDIIVSVQPTDDAKSECNEFWEGLGDVL